MATRRTDTRDRSLNRVGTFRYNLMQIPINQSDRGKTLFTLTGESGLWGRAMKVDASVFKGEFSSWHAVWPHQDLT